MKPSFLFSVILAVLLAACNSMPEIVPEDCVLIQDQSTWVKEAFKTNYSIQLPADFEGPGMVGFEGNTFQRHSPDSSIVLQYFYCSPLYCDDFGDTLQAPIPSSVQVMNRQLNLISTPFSTCFCKEEVGKGIFFYTGSANAKGEGVYYIGDPSLQLLEAVYVLYEAGELETVIDIIGTIQEN